MKPKVYVETSVISYLAAEPSPQLAVAAKQEHTREWWSGARVEVDVYVSDLVIAEIQRGNTQAAQARMDATSDVEILETSQNARSIARELLGQGAVPARAEADALHRGIAVAEGMDFVLTWNLSHLANAHMRTRITAVGNRLGYQCPVICTPEELWEPEG